MKTTTTIFSSIQNGVGWIKLNRPNVINSLSLDMVQAIYHQLREWKTDDDVALICISGSGDRGLCAGGDMRKFYDLKDLHIEQHAEEFLTTEYSMDYEIHNYTKPVIAYMDGIVMGGGVGISIFASHRIVTDTTKWAMPEMNIGFFPDIGASYFLNQMPGYIGRYLALTGEVIGPDDVLSIQAADYFIKQKNWEEIRRTIETNDWTMETAEQQLTELLGSYHQESTQDSTLAFNQQKIDQHFNYETVEEIIDSLHRTANEDNWAKEAKETLLSKSPISLKVALRQLQKGKKLTLKQALEMELILGMNFIHSDDFYEGLRAVLVDKDHQPKWNPDSLEAILNARVEQFFTYQKELKLLQSKQD